MTEAERIARARRAELAWDEFFAPMIEAMLGEYQARMVEVANTELNPRKRADKITALSNAIRIAQNLKDGMRETIRDGELVQQELIRADKVERMAPSARRLLNIAPY